jgi:NitT/TauT family transport system substrate-binding protein
MRLARTSVRVSALRTVPVAVLVAVLAAGCQSGGSSAGSGGGPITVGMVPGIDSAPMQVAMQDGIFQRYGLDVTLTKYATLDDEVAALRSGKAQIAVGDYTGFFYADATDGVQLRLIADGYDAASNSVAILALPPKPGAAAMTPQNLEGEEVATPPAEVAPDSASAPYNIQTLAAEEVLQNDGVSPSSVDWQQEPAQDMIADLRDGSVKAILVSEPYILEAEEQLGAVEVVNASNGVTSGLPMSGYFSLNSYASANPSAVQAFQQALNQAQADCDQRGPVQAVLPTLTGISSGQAALVTLGTYATSLNVGEVQRVASLMYDSGMVTSQITVSRLTSG